MNDDNYELSSFNSACIPAVSQNSIHELAYM